MESSGVGLDGGGGLGRGVRGGKGVRIGGGGGNVRLVWRRGCEGAPLLVCFVVRMER